MRGHGRRRGIARVRDHDPERDLRSLPAGPVGRAGTEQDGVSPWPSGSPRACPLHDGSPLSRTEHAELPGPQCAKPPGGAATLRRRPAGDVRAAASERGPTPAKRSRSANGSSMVASRTTASWRWRSRSRVSVWCAAALRMSAPNADGTETVVVRPGTTSMGALIVRLRAPVDRVQLGHESADERPRVVRQDRLDLRDVRPWLTPAARRRGDVDRRAVSHATHPGRPRDPSSRRCVRARRPTQRGPARPRQRRSR